MLVPDVELKAQIDQFLKEYYAKKKEEIKNSKNASKEQSNVQD